jgi:O-antigen/teichoic acid export membrane protein
LARVKRGSAASETREYGRSAALLTLALGSAGLLAYAFFAVASHTLDRDEYGEIVVLWSVVFVAASTLFRPIEQLLSRTLAEREEVGEDTGQVLRIAALIQAALSLAAVALLLLLRDPISDNLLEGGATLYWVLVVALVGFGGAFFARGFLAGRRQFGLYASLLVIEGTARLAFALAVAVGIADGIEAVALGICAAPLAGIAVIPLALRRRGIGGSGERRERRSGGTGGGSQLASPTEPEFTLSRGGAFAAAVLLMMLSEQIIISSGALFVRATEGAAAAGFIFNVLMVARAPLVLFQAIAASLLPHLTRLRTRGDPSGAEAFRMSVNTTLLTVAGFAVLTTIGVLAVGPEAMQLAFGDKFTYDRAGLAIVAVGMGFYLSAAALNQAALAQGQARRAAACWVLCATTFIVFNLAAPLDPYRTVEVGFAGAAALLAGLLYLLYAHPRPVVADAFEPGSAREIEARLAAADEIG